MLHYYLNLPKDFDTISEEANMKVSFAIMKTAIDSFGPFEKYLQNAISAMEAKEKITAKWEKIDKKNLAELKMIGRLYEVPKNQQILQLEIDQELSEGVEIIGNYGLHKIVSVNDKDLVLEPALKENELLFIEGKQISYSVKKIELPQGQIIREDTDRYVIYSSEKLDDFKEIKQIVSFVDFENLFFENGEKLDAERSEDMTVLLKHESDLGKTVISGGIKLTLDDIKKNNREKWLIQLSEIEDEKQSDELSGLSPLRYFFDDDISVVDGDDEKTEYRIDYGIERENKIALKRKNQKGSWDFCYPNGKTIKVKVNTYPLRMQKNAISALKRMPIDEHNHLIRLFEKRDEARWKRPIDEFVPEWFVITDEQRSGFNEQREFVKQALATPDFAVLEGPPGSGKTTVILELLCQLAKQGKRVLLCGSTHVAIDNILERLKEERNGQTLLEKFHILPIRIGDAYRINEDVREFQIDNLIKNNNIPDNTVELLLDSANLVCGTTIGILQHPKFKKRNSNRNWQIEPIIPEFDYLIIDESSKTTFQEFLVPALYAKKWVLAGDCLQLAPYTERDDIVSNIDAMSTVNKNMQNAVFYLHKLNDLLKVQKNKFIIRVTPEETREIKKEIQAGRNKEQLVEFITKENIRSINTLKLTAYSIIFVNSDVFDQVLPKLPETHAVLRYKNWNETPHAFAHNAFYDYINFFYKERGREYKNSFEITKRTNEYFAEKNWAEEITWRIEREHQLRLVEKNRTKENYTRVVDDLIPLSLNKEQVERNINMVAFMAFPSILESLVKGIKGRKVKFESTISEGFKKEDIHLRKTTLLFQHRMHPEISKFPREQFYENKALEDLKSPKPIEELRVWKYNKYPRRSTWVNVDGNEERSRNIAEAKELIKHLRQFVDWAKNNPQPEGEEKVWTVACLTFYRGQEKIIREELQKFTRKEYGFSNFDVTEGKYKINIKLHTVDKFQGHEADIVFLSMVQTKRVGFMDNPNRLNVAITRAKFQLVVIGKREYFLTQNSSDELKHLAQSMEVNA